MHSQKQAPHASHDGRHDSGALRVVADVASSTSGALRVQVDDDKEKLKEAMALEIASGGLNILQCQDVFEGSTPQVHCCKLALASRACCQSAARAARLRCSALPLMPPT